MVSITNSATDDRLNTTRPLGDYQGKASDQCGFTQILMKVDSFDDVNQRIATLVAVAIAYSATDPCNTCEIFKYAKTFVNPLFILDANSKLTTIAIAQIQVGMFALVEETAAEIKNDPDAQDTILLLVVKEKTKRDDLEGAFDAATRMSFGENRVEALRLISNRWAQGNKRNARWIIERAKQLFGCYKSAFLAGLLRRP